MSSYSTNEFKSGLKIILDGEPCVIMSNEFVKPGKGQAFNRVRIKKLISKKIFDKTYKSGEKVEAADVLVIDVSFLYKTTDVWYFIDDSDFSQYEVEKDIVGDCSLFLFDQCICSLTLWNGKVIGIDLPNFINLQVVDTEPGLKGDTQSTATKLAKVNSGAVFKVPLFVKNGDFIKVDTRTKSYVERVKI